MEPVAKRGSSEVWKLSKSLKKSAPSLRFETELWDCGVAVVAGVDEAGRGSWAGPLTVGAVVVPKDRRIYRVRDSKLLSAQQRQDLYVRIADWACAYGVGHVSEVECDTLGMSKAQRLAASRAIEALGLRVDHVLIDGSWDFVSSAANERPVGVTKIVKGDLLSLSIAAASIVAKVERDALMVEYSKRFPLYHFDSNKGYPCPRHREALNKHGPCELHRHSWSFIEGLPDSGIALRNRSQTLF